jgi:dipeptidase E
VSDREAVAEERTIVALGGGGFTMEPDNPALDELVLSLSGAATPRILFLPTASGDPTGQINAFRARFGGRSDCAADQLSLFHLQGSTRTLEAVVREQDVIYAGGGSMRTLLAIWRAHGLDELLVEAWERGTVLAGISAGAMCWFEGGVTKSSGPPEPIAGLGLLPGSLSVHADGEPERLPVWLDAVRQGALPGGFAADDGCALVFRGRRFDRAVSSRPGAAALRVDAVEGELVRRRIEPEPLDAPRIGGGMLDDDVAELRRVQRLRGRR